MRATRARRKPTEKGRSETRRLAHRMSPALSGCRCRALVPAPDLRLLCASPAWLDDDLLTSDAPLPCSFYALYCAVMFLDMPLTIPLAIGRPRLRIDATEAGELAHRNWSMSHATAFEGLLGEGGGRIGHRQWCTGASNTCLRVGWHREA